MKKPGRCSGRDDVLRSEMKTLVLLDIDGTLLLAGNIGQTSARLAFEETFGIVGSFDQNYPSGKTMEAILIDTLLEEGFSEADYQRKREGFYRGFFTEFEHRLEAGEHQIRPLPGGIALVDALSLRKDTITGLVTANHSYIARLKLSNAGYEFESFKAGGFGDQSRVRAELIKIARHQADSISGTRIPNERTFVIGDTRKDIEAAKGARVRSLAVCSGTGTKDELSKANPDYLLENLSDLQAVLEILHN